MKSLNQNSSSSDDDDESTQTNLTSRKFNPHRSYDESIIDISDLSTSEQLEREPKFMKYSNQQNVGVTAGESATQGS